MSAHRHALAGLLFGLAVWAIVLSLRLNPLTDWTRLQARGEQVQSVDTAMRAPAELYALVCASCHQSRGEGRFPVFPPLSGSPRINGDPQRLTALTLHGLSGPIDVNGVRYSGLMPGFPHLEDEEIAALLSHLRQSWGNDADTVTARDVSSIRRDTADRQMPWTAAELDAFEGSRP